MKSTLFAPVLLLISLSLGACTEEGHSPDCSAGGRGNLEDEGCVTPIGGACLSEKDFRANRPAERETTSGQEVTVDEDWAAYQCMRPLCGECFTEGEFTALDCEELDWNEYLEMRPACTPAP